MTIYGVLENLLSDLLFLIIASLFAWLIYILTRRNRLLKFFSVSKSRRIVIYLSNLRVKMWGAVGIDGRERSYQGPTAAFGEMVVANKFRELFNYFIPSLSESSSFLGKLLFSDVQVQLRHSPLRDNEIERTSSFITLGGDAYNKVSEFVERGLNTKVKFIQIPDDSTRQPGESPDIVDAWVGNSPSITSSGSTSFFYQPNYALPSGSPIPPPGSLGTANVPTPPLSTAQVAAISIGGVSPITDSSYGFVERLIDHTNNRAVFYAAGISELATMGAANYLITEWIRLHRKYGADTDFLVLLKFDLQDYKRWTIVFEK